MSAPDTFPNAGQQRALDALDAWWASDSPRPFVLHGVAGAGKTTTVRHWCQTRGVMFTPCAPTAKAARNFDPIRGRTAHSLLYAFPEDPLFGLVQQADAATGQERRELLLRIRQMRTRYPLVFETDDGKDTGAGVIVLDECGMADSKVAGDLVALGRRIIAVGDPHQLSPVQGVAAFQRADVTLTEPMRHGPGSDVFALAEQVRTAPLRFLGDLSRVLRPHFDPSAADQADMVLGATRNGVAEYNARRVDGREIPQPGDLVVCKVNESAKAHRGKGDPAYNGLRCVVLSADVRDDQVWLDLKGWDHEARWSGVTPLAPFRDSNEVEVVKGKGKAVWTWGRAVTIHASQGSGYGKVHILPDYPRWVAGSGGDMEEARRLLYTAVSRASESVTVG